MYEELVNRLRNTYTLPPSACALMNDAADAIEELSNPKWIPVTEKLPEIDKNNSCSKDVLVMLDGGTCCVAVYLVDTHGRKFFECNRILPTGASFGRVTHWMPLPSAPEPPKEEA